ncbi:MAG: hypothetical protein VX993_04650, partial [Candidatus Neomarinimicrobiota bacterium]|nr:hypothetical protein [Candidatus Neomarinimicrobiota bacterium]
MLYKEIENNSVEGVDNSDIIEEDTSVIEASADIEKEIKDYLNPELFNDIRTVPIEEIESKIDETINAEDIDKAYTNTLVDITEHQLIKGRVVGMNERDVLIDIGFKSEGIIDRSEFTDESLPAIGDQVEVYLEYLEDSSGNTILSKEKADFMLRWQNLREAYDN